MVMLFPVMGLILVLSRRIAYDEANYILSLSITIGIAIINTAIWVVVSDLSLDFWIFPAIGLTISILPIILYILYPKTDESYVGIDAWKFLSKADTNYHHLQPEEMVVQYVISILKTIYGYKNQDIEIEFPIQLGSSKKRADIVIFRKNTSHRQENIHIIIECKRADKKYRKSHELQLQSYMSACMNAQFGVLATSEWVIFEKLSTHQGFKFSKIPSLVNTANQTIYFDYQPPTPVQFSQ